MESLLSQKEVVQQNDSLDRKNDTLDPQNMTSLDPPKVEQKTQPDGRTSLEQSDIFRPAK